MNKQEEFLYTVQTVILANGIGPASDPPTQHGLQRSDAVSRVLSMMHDVVRASECIPDNMTASEAAREFCGQVLTTLRDDGSPARLPAWFTRG